MEEGRDLSLTADNCSELLLLCDEFGATRQKRSFEVFVGRVSVGSAVDFGFEKIELAFGEQMRSIVELKSDVGSFRSDFEGLKLEVEGGLAEGLNNLGLEVEQQKESIDRKLAAVVSRVGDIEGGLEVVRGEIKAVNDRFEGEIGKLKLEVEKQKESIDRKVGAVVLSLENLRAELAGQKIDVQRLQQDFTKMETDFRTLNGAIGTLKSQTEAVGQSVSRLENLRGEVDQLKSGLRELREDFQRFKVWFPMKEAKSLDGIISHLTQKRGGNVEEKGIVKITSKSVFNDDPKYALKNVADLTSNHFFNSKNEPGQWVCWDFGEMRVRPTHYTIWGWSLKSWVVEGSLDGGSWTEIDRQPDNQDFEGWNTASFAVSNPAEFRFIRLTQTGKNHKRHDGSNCLYLYTVEFFGTLSE
jgi:predicted  nucleic acid-binding Zn-ribbon protein